jgi:hypothetical protein
VLTEPSQDTTQAVTEAAPLEQARARYHAMSCLERATYLDKLRRMARRQGLFCTRTGCAIHARRITRAIPWPTSRPKKSFLAGGLTGICPSYMTSSEDYSGTWKPDRQCNSIKIEFLNKITAEIKTQMNTTRRFTGTLKLPTPAQAAPTPEEIHSRNLALARERFPDVFNEHFPPLPKEIHTLLKTLGLSGAETNSLIEAPPCQ